MAAERRARHGRRRGTRRVGQGVAAKRSGTEAGSYAARARNPSLSRLGLKAERRRGLLFVVEGDQFESRVIGCQRAQ